MKTIDLIDRPDLMAKRIIACYKSASPEAKENGREWYSQANYIAALIAQRYKVSLQVVCGVIAALSPATNWVQNIADTCNLLYAWSSGIDPEKVVVTTYGQNKSKAIRILSGQHRLTGNVTHIGDILLNNAKISKTHSFYVNILLSNLGFVTVDRHAVRIALNRKDSDKICVTEKRYRNVRDAYIKAADKLGYNPKDLQAITWIAYRENVAYTIPAAAQKLPEEIRAQIIG